MTNPASLLAVARTAVRQPHRFLHQLEHKARLFRRYRWVQRSGGATESVPAPLILKFLLTYRCNLYCTKCMLWGDSGWCTHSSSNISEELDFELLQRTLDDAKGYHPSLIFSGGEPFLYSHIGELLTIIREHRWPTTFCTNGTLLADVEKLLDANPSVSLLISLDGPEDINDTLRGNGVYARVTNSIKRLKSLARPPHIGIQFTLRQENVTSLVRFCKLMVELGVDWILLNLPWFISKQQADNYAAVLDRDFQTEACSQYGYQVPFELDPEVFYPELERIRSRRWPIQIGCYFQRSDEIWRYVNTPERPTGNDFCFKQWVRMDLLPSGKVTPCAQFPDIVLGNLKEQRLTDIWNGSAYAHFRRHIRTELLPVCSKCNALYLYDPGRTML